MKSDMHKMIEDGAYELDININATQIESIIRFIDELKLWNTKMNLTSIEDDIDIVAKHIIDSLSILPYIPDHAKTFIDIGTGAGFPGIPVKIVKDDIKVVLLDSLAKRIGFLQHSINLLKLRGIEAIHARAEDMAGQKEHRQMYDAAVARAVAPLNVLCEYCLPYVKQDGLFLAMKAKIANEIDDAKRALNILGGEIVDVINFTLPLKSAERNIIIIKKFRHTPTKYPRKAGKPSQTPL